MLFMDRDFHTNPPDCAGGHPNALDEAATALGQQIETYVVYLANADDEGGAAGPQALADATALARGLNPGLSYFFNASNGKAATAVAGEALSTVVADLGACVYDVPAGVGPEAVLQFPDVTKQGILNVKYAATCANDNELSNPTWVFDNQHIRICQDTCQGVIRAIQADEAATALANEQSGTTNTAAGITVYATEGCDVPSAGPIVESGTVPNDYDANVNTGSDDAGGSTSLPDAGVSDDAGPSDGGAG
jgi:hypothetical protein